MSKYSVPNDNEDGAAPQLSPVRSPLQRSGSFRQRSGKILTTIKNFVRRTSVSVRASFSPKSRSPGGTLAEIHRKLKRSPAEAATEEETARRSKEHAAMMKEVEEMTKGLLEAKVIDTTFVQRVIECG